jgi:DNA-binding winged helix-turn-helix (wHTH) protein/TolB-like protein
MLEFGPFRYDPVQRLLFRGSETVPLPPKAIDTLHALLERRGELVEKGELMRLVWPDVTVEEVGLARNISLVRKALGDESEGAGYIETIPKRGYRFVAEVKSAGGEAPPRAEPRRRSWRGVFAFAALVLLGALSYWQFYRPSPYLPTRAGATAAVLPFENLTPAEVTLGEVEALNELLAAELAHSSSVTVVSPSTLARYRAWHVPTPIMARLLRVDATLEGTVERSRGTLRLTARLADVHSGKLIWAANYERSASEATATQTELAKTIGSEVSARLTSRAR